MGSFSTTAFRKQKYPELRHSVKHMFRIGSGFDLTLSFHPSESMTLFQKGINYTSRLSPAPALSYIGTKDQYETHIAGKSRCGEHPALERVGERRLLPPVALSKGPFGLFHVPVWL